MFKRNQFKISNRWGIRLTSTWLIISGIIPVLNLHFSNMSIIMGVLAIAAGIALLLDL